MSGQLYTDFTFASAVALTALGCILLGIGGIPDRDNPAAGKLHTARRILALTCLLLAVPGYMELCLPVRDGVNAALIAPFTLAGASFQSLLFTVLFITFIRPEWSTRRRVARHLAIVAAAVAAYLVLRFAFSLRWTTGVALAAYLGQLVCYTALFRRQYTAGLRRLEAYYDEDEEHRLRWVRFGFCTALAVGVLASVSAWLSPAAYNLFTAFYTVFYIWFTVRFFNYAAEAAFYLKPASAPAETASVPGISEQELPERTERLRQALAEWAAAREFTRCDVDTRTIAAGLGTDIPFLRHYFRTEMSSDFRSWRMELRIAYARELLAGSPSLSVNRISREAGFASSSNFYRYFREATGETPADFRRRLASGGKK